MMKYIWLLALLVSSVLLNPPSIHATSPPVPPIAGCDVNGTCTGTYTMTWGYCQWSTYQTAKTFTVTMEIGINSGNISDACEIPFATGGSIKIIDGVTNYTPWSANLSSMFLNIRACSANTCTYPTQQEHLLAHKYTAKVSPVTVPFSKTFTVALPTTAVIFVFNDDLVNAKPTTINASFSGTFQ